MEKIVEITKSEENYFLSVRVNGKYVVTSILKELPEVYKYKTYTGAIGRVCYDDTEIDFDELIIDGKKINSDRF